jgi:hypothetical protein
MPRNALLPGATCTCTGHGAAPLFCLQVVIPDGAAVVGAPHTAVHSKVVPLSAERV